MTNRTITVGTDFSEQSNTALEQASWLARRKDAELLLTHVGAPAPPETSSLLPSVRYWESIARQRADADDMEATKMAKRVAAQGLRATHHHVNGEPAEGLVEFASDRGSETIVVGTHGLTGAQFLLLGSVAQGVIRHAQCNVWVARPSSQLSQGPIRILMGTDFSDYSAEALRGAIEIAPDDSIIDIVHSWPVPVPVPWVASPALAALSTGLRRSAEEQGKKLLEEHATHRVQLSFRAIAGPAASTLIEHSLEESVRYDLVVVGSHGRRGFKRFFLGSVAEKVTRHAPCSVLVVHRPS